MSQRRRPVFSTGIRRVAARLTENIRILERVICPVLDLFPGEMGMRRTEVLHGIRETQFECLLEHERVR